MNSELLLTHFDRISEAPNAIPRLRSFILDLAVRGKLVEQELQTERVRDEYLNEPTSDHLPQNWRLLNFGKFCDIQGGNQPPKSLFVAAPQPGYVRLFQIRDLGENPIPTYIPVNTTNRFCREGEILIGRYGASVGKVFWGQEGAYNVALAKFIFPESAYLPQFAFLALKSGFFQTTLVGATRSAQAGFNKGDLADINFPLPPIIEQHRIVAKVNELMTLCDRLEAAQREQESRQGRVTAAILHRLNNGSTVEDFRRHASFYLTHLSRFTHRPAHLQLLRETILNLAVQGKLVLQSSSDEPASGLLKRIQAEKASLTKDRFLRKEKPLPPIDEDKVPFAVPASWTWAKIGTCSLLTEYGTSVKSDAHEDGIPILAMGNIQDGQVILSERKKVPFQIEDLPQLFLKRFDLLYNRTNSAELVGKTGIFLGDDDTYTFASYLIRIRFLNSFTSPLYANLAMNAPYFRVTQILPELQQQCGQANVNGTKLRNMLIPLPPLAEQHKIVAKVNELMAVCDQLEQQLTILQAESCHLLEAVLHHALNDRRRQIDKSSAVLA